MTIILSLNLDEKSEKSQKKLVEGEDKFCQVEGSVRRGELMGPWVME